VFPLPVNLILDGETLAGKFPKSKARLVQAWIEIHREELLADWQLAVNGEEVFKIDPLR
jgi:predicted DNA-binding protein